MKYFFCLLFFLNSCTYLSSYLPSSSPFKIPEKEETEREFKESKQANMESRVQEIESEILLIRGKQEELEKKINDTLENLKESKEENVNEKKEQERTFHAYREELENLKKSFDHEMKNVKRKLKKRSYSKKAFNFSQAQKDFSRKKWSDAAQGYKAYLDKNPRGKYKTLSYYRIAYCFEQLKQKKEALYFYKKAYKNSPRSKIGKKASQQMKKLK